MLQNFNVKDFLTSIAAYVIAVAVMLFICGFFVNFFSLGSTMRNITSGIGLIFALGVVLAGGKSIHADILVGAFLLYDAFMYPRISWDEGIAGILFAIMAVGKWKK